LILLIKSRNSTLCSQTAVVQAGTGSAMMRCRLVVFVHSKTRHVGTQMRRITDKNLSAKVGNLLHQVSTSSDFQYP